MDPIVDQSAIETLLSRWRSGDGRACDELASLLYQELRGIAEYRLRMSPGHSIVPTELVHEAFVKLVQSPNHTWENRRHFINAAGVAMRSILVDRARAKRALKRTAPQPPPSPEGSGSGHEIDSELVLSINHAIAALDLVDPRAARVVTLRYFAGLTEPEMAEVLGVHERTIRRDWLFARAWLRRYMEPHAATNGEHPA